MELCDAALLAAREGRASDSMAAFSEAFEHERQAAAETTVEPSRSVLHRSAAALAMRARRLRESEQTIAAGLAGDPPEEIAEELRDLWEQVTFERHLQTRGIALSEDELQLSISGKQVGFGIAPVEDFVDRVQVMEKMLIRTVERMQRRPFRESGRPLKELSKNYELFIKAPRAASFAVTLKIGLRDKPPLLPGMQEQIEGREERAVRELTECFEIFFAGGREALAERIPDPAYRRNFAALVEQLAPDGERIRTVGVTATRGEQDVFITVPQRAEMREDAITTGPIEVAQAVTVVGRLLVADSYKSNAIKVVDDEGSAWKFRVPPGMMADIVRPLFEMRVAVRGIRRGKGLQLDGISLAPVDAGS